MTNVVKLKPSFTRAEALIAEVRDSLFGTKRSYKDLAESASVSPSTVRNFAKGKTQWPRPKTLFPLLDTLGLEMRLVRKGAR